MFFEKINKINITNLQGKRQTTPLKSGQMT